MSITLHARQQKQMIPTISKYGGYAQTGCCLTSKEEHRHIIAAFVGLLVLTAAFASDNFAISSSDNIAKRSTAFVVVEAKYQLSRVIILPSHLCCNKLGIVAGDNTIFTRHLEHNKGYHGIQQGRSEILMIYQ